MVGSVDVYRPAAREQLRVIARDISQPIYEGAAGESLRRSIFARSARREATNNGARCHCWSIPPGACTSTIS